MKDGGPAFPNDGAYAEYVGMTLRDYFAAHCPWLSGAQLGMAEDKILQAALENAARDAYRWADALLAEREKS